MKQIRLKEIPFESFYCIYADGHVAPSAFLDAVKAMQGSDVPDDTRARLTVDNVKHIRFRRMSPTEARSRGFDWGVFETTTGGYPVTAVML